MDTYLFSIHPKWCEKIFNGEKTIEVRKTAPKPPFKVVVYCTKAQTGSYKGNLYINPPKKRKEIGVADWWSERKDELSINGGYLQFNAFLAHGKVIGEFICEKVDKISVHNDTVYSVGNLFADKLKNMCLTVAELKEYLGAKNKGYAIGITAPKLYGKPKGLGEFYSIKQCKPCDSPFGYSWSWDDRHKRNTGGRDKKYRPVPIECHRCKSLVGGKDYLDEKSGCILFDYECVSKYHKPLERPPQSYMRIQDTKEERK